MVKKFTLPEFGYEVEIGKFAGQADGAVWIKQGGTIVLSTVVSASTSEFPGFLPLTVDYRELFSAAGKIPGGYYKREGKSTDKEVLTARLIDRSIRPLFSDTYFNQVQSLSTVYSVDKEHAPAMLALNAVSLALTVSKIPFLGPVGGVEVGRLNGQWVINPKYQDSLKSEARLIIAGTYEGICMVEGSMDQISEDEMVDILFRAHEEIRKLVTWQREIQKEVGHAKEAMNDGLDWDALRKHASNFLTPARVLSINVADKVERSTHMAALQAEFIALFGATESQVTISEKVLKYVLDLELETKLTDLIITQKRRIDNRDFETVRPITTEVGLLPFAHGSALFQRGRTQALVSVTLGSGEDEQRIEGIMDEESGTFMLHYNFPPFSVGEVRPQRGPGRREVGHGHLAASSFRFLLPDKASFPYTMRIVADILESDGSSSMATTCGTTMALMQAGVPIKKMVSGIAMGLLQSSNGVFTVLSDISGFEDAFGLMDFKVTGTADGICAIQMDIKHKGGLPREVMKNALAQAKHGRLHILHEMQKVMTKPNAQLSDLVPKFTTLKVEQDKIGAIIGTGGKTIREIIEKSGVTSIDIEADGLVKIFSGPEANTQMAVSWIKTLAGQIDAGQRYEGKVRRIADFGIFVELVPGQDGLVHISQIPRDWQRDLAKHYPIDSILPVEVIEYDKATGRIRLRPINQ